MFTGFNVDVNSENDHEPFFQGNIDERVSDGDENSHRDTNQ